MFNNIYINKKVLVTGHTGFKGSWLVTWLLELGAEIIGISLESPTNPNLYSILNIGKDITHNLCDIRKYENIFSVFDKYRPEIIFHLAAQSLVGASYKDPVLTYETNIMGTVNVLEAARKTDSVKVIINITTDKCYENKEWIYGYRENDPMGGYDPYSSSKGCSELITNAYRTSFFSSVNRIALATARAGNVIGGGDWAEDRLIPDCIRSLVKNNSIEIRNPYATRPWQHVLEPLSGYLWLGALMFENKIKYNEGWNFGPEDESIVSVENIVNKIIKIWGNGNYDSLERDKYHEAQSLKLDISKSRFHLKWKPVYNLETAIEETVLWYKQFYQKETQDMFEFTKQQIHKYAGIAREKGLIWSMKKNDF